MYKIYNQKDLTYSRIVRLNIVKMSILPKLVYKFNTISINLPASTFGDKIIQKFIWKGIGLIEFKIPFCFVYFIYRERLGAEDRGRGRERQS